MRSPFSFFRRHQKLMLAGLGVLAMFGFVILPVILEGLQVAPQRNILVATSRLGNVRESTLAELMRQRGVALRFLNVVADALYQVGENPRKVNEVYQRIGSATEESVLQRWLLARYGERLGITVDARAVNEFIAELTEGKISGPVLEQMLDRQGISVDYLFRVLREELLALRVQDFLLTNLGGFTPAQHWEYFQRLNRRVTVETVVLPVERFVDWVPDPPESELRKFFEQHRFRVPHPDDPQPGFMEPKRVAVEWAKASLERFVDQTREKVTEEEIAAYYNENKDRLYVREPLPSLPGTPGQGQPAASQAADRQSPETPQGTTPPAEGTEGGPTLTEPATSGEKSEKEATQESVSSPSLKGGGKQESENSSQNSSPEGGDAAALGGPSQMDVESAASLPSGEDSSAGLDGSSEQGLRNSEQEGAQLPEEGTKSGGKADLGREEAEEPGDGDGAEHASAGGPGGETSSAPKPAVSPPGAEPAAEAQPGGSSEGGPKESGTSQPAASKEYIPLEKVREEIRNTLARRKAVQQMEELLERLQAQLGRYRDEKILYDLEVQQRRTARRPEPQRPNLRALAEEYGLEYQQSGLVADFELQSLEIGEATSPGGVSVLELVFRRLPLFRPAVVRDLRANQYLLWKVEEKEARVPEFSDSGMREKVLREWKLIQAREIARSEAEKLAAQARQAGKSLAEVFADQADLKVELSDPFSWLTTSLPLVFWYQEPPRISQVKGVDRPGEEFMRTVFRLKPGEIGVAMNHPQRVVCIIRLVESQPSDDILWQQFITDPGRLYLVAAQYDTASVLGRLMEHVRRECDFQLTPEWQRRRAERPYDYE